MPDADSQPTSAGHTPTVADVQRIASLEDPVVRNLQITQCYYELSATLAKQLPHGANWCSVATWASRQAGQSIRREDLRRALARLVQQSPEVDEAATALEAQSAAVLGDNTESLVGAASALKEALSPAAAFDRVSDAVGRGNRKVFAEIGLAFAQFLDLFSGGRPSSMAVAEFCAGLRPGDPPNGQRYLRQAFAHYYTAGETTDEKAGAELLLMANLEIGFHEQTRLQPEIRDAMDAPIYDPVELRRRLLRELLPDPGSRLRLAILTLSGRAGALLAARDRLADEAQQLAREVVTEHMMVLELSRGRLLHLGVDLHDPFPILLQAIDNPELRVLLAQVDPTPDSLAATGSVDWSRLDDRMHFIADLFRVYHLDEGLFDPPFTADQVALLRAGIAL
jgi:hypothetical protein